MLPLTNLSEYHRPDNLADALQLLQRESPRTAPLAGGATLAAEADPALEAVVDLRNLGLTYITPAGDTLRIGATTTLQQLVDSDALAATALPATARQSAGRTIRSMATVGGEIAAGGGGSPVLTTLLALDARITLQASAESQLPITNYLHDRNSGLITSVEFNAAARTVFEHVGRTPSDAPLVCAVAALDSGVVRLALGGVGSAPVRATAAEERLAGQTLTEQALDSALAALDFDPPDDHFASAEYRRAVARTLARRALQRLISNP